MTLKREDIERLLSGVKESRISVEEALADLSTSSLHDLEFAHVDIHREKRKGVPEVILWKTKLLRWKRRWLWPGSGCYPTFVSTSCLPASPLSRS
ncbi:hypothetical protein [Candidatus Hakubella thermalkaliphila]|uniref:hypothetical protein n=1 Tax=Candidatus Hakubella thermalkaliphila TaxID=2754717 RepID=UPI001592EFA1|nr:hypothetical protein [Candidatus Hakubella thermalkaliphila]